MCFRPPSPGKPKKCPNCGTLNPNVVKSCIKCKTDLTSVNDEKQVEEKTEDNAQ